MSKYKRKASDTTLIIVFLFKIYIIIFEMVSLHLIQGKQHRFRTLHRGVIFSLHGMIHLFLKSFSGYFYNFLTPNAQV